MGNGKRDQPNPLSGLLLRYRYKLATDPRDKVYGILGLTSPSIQKKFAISYQKSTAQVYIEAVTAVIEEEKDFSIVLENKRPPAFDATADMNYGLPTWVSNFHNRGGNENLSLIDQFSDDWIGASGSTALVATVRGKILSTKGITVGRITSVGSVMPEKLTFELDFPLVFKIIYEWWLIYVSSGGQTVLGDRDSFVNIVNYGAWYRKWTYMSIAMHLPWGLTSGTL
jgi:hypothetical protein